MRAALLLLFLSAAPSWAQAACLTGGNVNVCDDLTDGDARAFRNGGTFTSAGWRVDVEGDFLRYDFPGLVTAATVRFDVKGLGPGALTLDDSLLIMLQAVDGTPDLTNSMGLRVGGPPGYLVVLEAWDSVAEVKKFSGPMTWDPQHTYRIELKFDANQLEVRRDGALIYAFDTIFSGHQVAIGYRQAKIPSPRIPAPTFGVVTGSTYALFSIAGTAAGVVAPDAGGTTPDAGHPMRDGGAAVPDAGLPVVDAGGEPEPDAGAPAAPDAGSGERDDSSTSLQSGCSSTLAAPVLAALLALWLRERRRCATERPRCSPRSSTSE